MGGPADKEYPNVWPAETEISGFRSFMEQYWQKSHEIALDVLGALELALELPAGSFVNRCNGCKSELRMNHYPEAPIKKLSADNFMRIWPHTDASAITLLVQDSNGGLEIESQTSPGVYESMPLVDRTELIVNGGETLERWTNGLLRPVLHQVNLPTNYGRSSSSTVPSRRSVAFFVNANAEASMAPLNHFLPSGQAGKFEEMTSRAYHRLRNAVVY